MVDILADPGMIGFKRGKPIYQIRESDLQSDPRRHIKEDYESPYKSSKAGCL